MLEQANAAVTSAAQEFADVSVVVAVVDGEALAGNSLGLMADGAEATLALVHLVVLSSGDAVLLPQQPVALPRAMRLPVDLLTGVAPGTSSTATLASGVGIELGVGLLLTTVVAGEGGVANDGKAQLLLRGPPRPLIPEGLVPGGLAPPTLTAVAITSVGSIELRDRLLLAAVPANLGGGHAAISTGADWFEWWWPHTVCQSQN